MNDLRGFLNNFLDTINYPDNKEDFINKLLTVIYLETIGELIKTLPSEKQTLITQALDSAKTPEALQQLINSTFNQNLFHQTLQKTSQKVFNDYLQTIETALTEDQKNKLTQYFSSLRQNKE